MRRNDFFKYLLLGGGGSASRSELESETLPYTFVSKSQRLKDYRIYGNTVDGESVGDLVTEGEHSGEYLVPVTVDGKNYLQSSDFEAGAIYTGSNYKNWKYPDSKTPSGMTDYDSTRKRSTNLISVIGTYTISIADGWEFAIIMFPNRRNSGQTVIYYTLPVTISDCTFAIQLRKTDISDISSADISDYQIMLAKGSTATPYEPYHAPDTTNLYLPEQIKMVGDEAEYVDYKKQKLHRVRRNLCDNDNLLIGFYSTSGAFNNDSNFRTSNFIAVHPNTNYTVSFFENGIRTGSLVTIFWNQFKQVIQEISTGTFTTPQNCEYITIRNFSSQSSALVNDYAFQVEKGSAVTEYEPYIENDEIDVVIPALPIAEGTNTLSIGTAVQPSKIWIQGNVSEIPPVSASLNSIPQSLRMIDLSKDKVSEPENEDLQLDIVPVEKYVINLKDSEKTIEPTKVERGVESAE